MQGLCKAIGVSNFGIGHLEQLLSYATVSPAVNQIELSPFLQRTELVDYCRSKDIVLEVRTPYCCSFQDTWIIMHAVRFLQVSGLSMHFTSHGLHLRCLSYRAASTAWTPTVIVHAQRCHAMQAYSPLCKATKLSHPVIGKVAARHQKTPAQVTELCFTTMQTCCIHALQYSRTDQH